MPNRKIKHSRKTNETNIEISINIDGNGSSSINTGNEMFDHMLSQLSKHGLIDLDIKLVSGDSGLGWHHVVEDLGIILGQSFSKCIGDGKGITRTSHAYVPLDETLVRNVIDFGGRGYFKLSGYIGDSDLGELSGSLITHFLETFSREAKCNLFTTILEGVNNHHISEAMFKSLGIVLKNALTLDPRRNTVPSTKGTIS
ncbi:MAG: imidazoleglycerol-phosphate dehydratase [Chloroflexi bacterium]|nr:imidazoleglycerol-phosphate dehydratase [Chloroflexota bacterium]|tara:strand:- start:1292 stop:1888 length:597 start_codon:yes stop_codon:yes gene_type:complete